eukprot:g4122.t1
MSKKEILSNLQNIVKKASNGNLIAIVHGKGSGAVRKLTSSSQDIFLHLPMLQQTVVGLFVLQSFRSYCESIGDGGLRMMELVIQLVLNAGERCPQKIFALRTVISWLPSMMTAGFSCTDATGKYVVERLKWNDKASILQIIANIIHPKAIACGLNDLGIDHMSNILLSGFVDSLQNFPGQKLPEPNVSYITIEGCCSTQSRIVKNVLYLDVKLNNGVQKLLYERKLTATRERGQSLLLYCNELEEEEVENLHQFTEMYLKRLQKLRVDIIGSQKGISRYFQNVLLNEGIIPVQRLSLRYIGPIASLSGAVVLSNIHHLPKKDHLGYITDLREVHLPRSKTKYLALTGYDKSDLSFGACDSWRRRVSPLCTVVLCARSFMAKEQLLLVCKSVFKVLTELLRSPLLLRKYQFAHCDAGDEMSLVYGFLSASIEAKLLHTTDKFLHQHCKDFLTCIGSIPKVYHRSNQSHQVESATTVFGIIKSAFHTAIHLDSVTRVIKFNSSS